MNTLITVAPTGAEVSPEQAPTLPVTLEQLVATAVACEAIGAGLIHVHVRDDAALPTLELGRLTETVAALRECTSMVVQLSTGGSVTDPFEHRLRVLEARPQSCSLTMGTVNFGTEVFSNPWPFIVELYQRTQELEVVPEFELFDLGQVSSLGRLLKEHGLPFGGKVHCDFVMGVPGGMPGNPAALVAAVQQLPPEVTSWSATGIGRTSLPVALTALALGGHLRVGMEDTLAYAAGQPVRDNRQLVERAVRLAELAGRPPMTGAGAAELLGIGEAARPG